MNRVMEFERVMIDHETCWQAVLNRDPAFDAQFVYAVRSTGVYCRVTCPSRRPRREQVVFFETPAEAQAGGFRPCRRCRPDEALPAERQAELARRACALMDAAGENPISLEALSRELNLSPSHFHRLFKAATGLTPRQYAAGQRLQKLKSNLKAGQDVTRALYDAGYSSSSRLYEKASATLGMTPAVYRRGGETMEINYTLVDTRLGRMLLAATLKGICFLSFGDQDGALADGLQAEYPAAHLTHDVARLKPWADALVAHLEGARPQIDLPLDLQATAFQLKVWEVLRQIPYGETRTYTQVAGIIGSPKAVRAVGSACASNPVSVITPCHRVLRTDGTLGGYRWGLERKQALLDQERLHAK